VDFYIPLLIISAAIKCCLIHSTVKFVVLHCCLLLIHFYIGNTTRSVLLMSVFLQVLFSVCKNYIVCSFLVMLVISQNSLLWTSVHYF